MFSQCVRRLTLSVLIGHSVYNKFSDLYFRINSIEVRRMRTDAFLVLCQVSLRWLLERDPQFPFMRIILSRVDSFTDRLDLVQKMSVVDEVLQQLFYEDTNFLGKSVLKVTEKAGTC